MTQTKFLDLDAIAPEMELTVKLGGERHKFRPTSVEGFLKNTKRVQDFMKSAESGDQLAEFQIGVEMILESFPSMTAKMLNDLTFAQLKALQDWIKSADGTAKVEEEAQAEVAAENPPAASSPSTSDSPSAG